MGLTLPVDFIFPLPPNLALLFHFNCAFPLESSDASEYATGLICLIGGNISWCVQICMKIGAELNMLDVKNYSFALGWHGVHLYNPNTQEIHPGPT